MEELNIFDAVFIQNKEHKKIISEWIDLYNAETKEDAYTILFQFVINCLNFNYNITIEEVLSLIDCNKEIRTFIKNNLITNYSFNKKFPLDFKNLMTLKSFFNNLIFATKNQIIFDKIWLPNIIKFLNTILTGEFSDFHSDAILIIVQLLYPLNTTSAEVYNNYRNIKAMVNLNSSNQLFSSNVERNYDLLNYQLNYLNKAIESIFQNLQIGFMYLSSIDFVSKEILNTIYDFSDYHILNNNKLNFVKQCLLVNHTPSTLHCLKFVLQVLEQPKQNVSAVFISKYINENFLDVLYPLCAVKPIKVVVDTFKVINTLQEYLLPQPLFDKYDKNVVLYLQMFHPSYLIRVSSCNYFLLSIQTINKPDDDNYDTLFLHKLVQLIHDQNIPTSYYSLVISTFLNNISTVKMLTNWDAYIHLFLKYINNKDFNIILSDFLYVLVTILFTCNNSDNNNNEIFNFLNTIVENISDFQSNSIVFTCFIDILIKLFDIYKCNKNDNLYLKKLVIELLKYYNITDNSIIQQKIAELLNIFLSHNFDNIEEYLSSFINYTYKCCIHCFNNLQSANLELSTTLFVDLNKEFSRNLKRVSIILSEFNCNQYLLEKNICKIYMIIISLIEADQFDSMEEKVMYFKTYFSIINTILTGINEAETNTSFYLKNLQTFKRDVKSFFKILFDTLKNNDYNELHSYTIIYILIMLLIFFQNKIKHSNFHEMQYCFNLRKNHIEIIVNYIKNIFLTENETTNSIKRKKNCLKCLTELYANHDNLPNSTYISNILVYFAFNTQFDEDLAQLMIIIYNNKNDGKPLLIANLACVVYTLNKEEENSIRLDCFLSKLIKLMPSIDPDEIAISSIIYNLILIVAELIKTNTRKIDLNFLQKFKNAVEHLSNKDKALLLNNLKPFFNDMQLSNANISIQRQFTKLLKT